MLGHPAELAFRLSEKLYQVLNLPKDTWGCIIFRTAYGPGYDEKFLRALTVLDSWVADEAYQVSHPTTPPVDDHDRQVIGDNFMKTYRNIIFDDELMFKVASVEDLCHHVLSMVELLNIEIEYLDIETTTYLWFDASEIDRISSCTGCIADDEDEVHDCVASFNPWRNLRLDEDRIEFDGRDHCEFEYVLRHIGFWEEHQRKRVEKDVENGL